MRLQLTRFVVVGGASVGTDLAAYALLVGLGLPAHPAKGASYVAGMLLGFAGNKWWTFRSQRRSAAEPLLYCLLYAATLAVNVAVNGLVLGLCGGRARWLAFLVATGVTTVLNFAGLRWVAFREGIRQRLRAAAQEHSLQGA